MLLLENLKYRIFALFQSFLLAEWGPQWPNIQTLSIQPSIWFHSEKTSPQFGDETGTEQQYKLWWLGKCSSLNEIRYCIHHLPLYYFMPVTNLNPKLHFLWHVSNIFVTGIHSKITWEHWYTNGTGRFVDVRSRNKLSILLTYWK